MHKEAATVSFVGQNNKWNTEDDASNVVKALNETKEVQCLKLEANTLGVDSAKVIGDALAQHPEFERAHWNDLFTGRLKKEIPEALKHLFSGLIRAKAKLIELDLSDNALGPVGVEGMVDFMQSPVCYSLQELRLNNNGLGIKGGTMLANSLKKLVHNAKTNGTPLQLKIFICGRNRLEIEGASIFGDLFSSIGTLEEIQMPQNGIFKKGIAALAESFAKNPNLRHINLNDNTFTPEGAKSMANHLPSMQNLEIINFGDCLLKTAGAKHLADVLLLNQCKLKELYLDCNEIGIEGGLAIADAIANNKPNFKHLMLDGNQFGEDRRDELPQKLFEYGIPKVLGSLDDDEDPDSEEEGGSGEEEEVNSEDEDEYTTEEEEVIENFCGISPFKRGGFTPTAKTDVRVIPECTPSDFYCHPTNSRLMELIMPELELVEEVFKIARTVETEEIIGMPTSTMTLITEFCHAFILVAQFGDTSDEKVLARVDKCASALLKAGFDCALKVNIMSVATNTLLVYLGLVKNEDKSFRLEWNLKGVLKTLSRIVGQPFFPKDTRTTLQLFLSKANKHVDAHLNEKHKLLSVLYQV